MSATLVANPDDDDRTTLDDSLRYRLGRKLFDTDGTIGGATLVGAELLPYLAELQAEGVKDADTLKAMIEKGGEVLLTWEH